MTTTTGAAASSDKPICVNITTPLQQKLCVMAYLDQPVSALMETVADEVRWVC